MADYNEYYEVMSMILSTVRDVIARDIKDNLDEFTVENFSARNGSSLFEEAYKWQIRYHHSTIIEEAQEVLDSHYPGWEVREITADLNDSDSKHRTSYDFTVALHHADDAKDVIRLEYVNIKASSGGSADNICGWNGAVVAIFGSDTTIAKRGEFYEYIKKNAITNDNSEYWIFAFDKSKEGKAMLSSGKVFSLLSVPPNIFTYNGSQSFPLQLNYRKANVLQTGSALSRKVNFLNHLFSKDEEYHINKSQLIKEMLSHLATEYPAPDSNDTTP